MIYKNSSIDIQECAKPTHFNFKDLEGKQFNDLYVVRFIGRHGSHFFFWECRCVCGNVIAITTNNLRSGAKSCGCKTAQAISERRTTHGRSNTAAYRVWHAIKNRCLKPRHSDFPNYGGRGITICDRWRTSFEAFMQDMGERPTATHTIDRIDNSKGYSPDNCRWATRTEQSRNRRDNVMVTFQGETRCIAEWAERLNMNHETLFYRFKYGWSVERALTTPVRPQKKRKQL